MATKPTLDDSRWATDESNNTAPSSGQKDTGWTPGQTAVSDYFNVLGLQAYKWHQYLDDGILSTKFGLSALISPSAITGANANYAPTGFADAFVIRQDLSAAASISGLAAPSDGRIVTLVNLSGTYDLQLVHDATSTAANRFTLPEGKDLYLVGAGSYATLWYDTTSDRWRVIATNGRQPKTVYIAALKFALQLDSDLWATSSQGTLFAGATPDPNSWFMPLELPVGTRVTEMLFYAAHGAESHVVAARAQFRYADAVTGGGTLVGEGTSTADSADVTYTVASLPHTILTGKMYNFTWSTVQPGDAGRTVKITYY